MNHESKIEYFLFVSFLLVFQSVSRANTANMNNPPLVAGMKHTTRL
jgi:hypothetical protein